MSKKFGIGKQNLGTKVWGAKKEFEFKKFDRNIIVTSRCREANTFEFEFKGLEGNKIGKAR